jgi:hypothetical protein
MFFQILDIFAAQVAILCAPMLAVKAMLMFVSSNIVENALILETAANC